MNLALTIFGILWLMSAFEINYIIANYRKNFIKFWDEPQSIFGITFNHYWRSEREKIIRTHISRERLLNTAPEKLHTLCYEQEREEWARAKMLWDKLWFGVLGYLITLFLITIVSLGIVHNLRISQPVKTEVITPHTKMKKH